MDWIKHHEYLAAWAGAIATVITLISRLTKPSSSVTEKRVSLILLFFAFALEATIAFSPAAGIATRIFAGITALVSFLGLFLAWFKGD
jgi:hypothetical protein